MSHEYQRALVRTCASVGHLDGVGKVQLDGLVRLSYEIDIARRHTGVKATVSAVVELFAAFMEASISVMLIFDTLLLWSISLCPKGPPPLLVKKTSLVPGIHMGASCAKAQSGLDAMTLKEGLGPRISRKAGSKAWKKGGVMFVGLKNSVNADDRKDPLMPMALYCNGSTT